MTKIKTIFISGASILLSAMVLTMSPLALAEDDGTQEKPILDPKADTVRFPGILVKAKEQVIEVEGRVCLSEGILEFVAVTPEGREYESILSLNCKPSHLKAALLLIGCEEGGVSLRAQGIEPQPGDVEPKIGERLLIRVEWKNGDKIERAPVEQFLIDRRTGEVAADLPWIFTGSVFGKNLDGREVFLADVEGIFVSLWYNAMSLINLNKDFGNPYQNEKEGFELNKKAIPPLDTPIKLIIERAQK